MPGKEWKRTGHLTPSPLLAGGWQEGASFQPPVPQLDLGADGLGK